MELSESYKKRLIQLAGLIKESNFYLPDNSLVNNMNLTPVQVGTLQDIINLMLTDKHWISLVYPNGYTATNVVLDITNLFDNTRQALDIIRTKNPIKYANSLKDAIKKKKGIA